MIDFFPQTQLQVHISEPEYIRSSDLEYIVSPLWASVLLSIK